MTLIDDTFARLMAGGKKAFISVSCVATPGSSCLGRGLSLIHISEPTRPY